MGIVQSKKDLMTDNDLLTLLDFMSSKYLLSSMYEEMTNLKDPKYCNDLVIISSDLLDENFTSKEIDYIYSKKVSSKPDKSLKISENIKYLKEGEEQEEEQEEQEQEEEQEEEEIKREKLIYGSKKDLNKFSKEIHLKKKYKCIGIAKFYVKIAHIYAAIMTTINPIYKFRDDSGVEQIIKMSELKDTELPADVSIEPAGICDSRIKMLEENYEYLKTIRKQVKETDTEKKTNQVPPHCKERRTTLANEPGIPELERLYYDVYDFKDGVFNDMSSDMKQIYLKDVKKFYKAFTGKDLSPEDNIDKFSDIELHDYSKTDYCKTDSEYLISDDLSLIEKYGLHIKETLNKTKENHSSLIDILDYLFGFTFDGEDIMIRPEINYEDLGEIVENTTRIIVNLYTECEKDFKKGIDIFQALIAFKEIELAPLQQEAASEAAYVSMVNV
mgnify:CR=1 FL=1|tara:strand:+ start:16409 stop:17737 length:1329 start_codon:yes stop_codon:yes gene_type:complete